MSERRLDDLKKVGWWLEEFSMIGKRMDDRKKGG